MTPSYGGGDINFVFVLLDELPRPPSITNRSTSSNLPIICVFKECFHRSKKTIILCCVNFISNGERLICPAIKSSLLSQQAMTHTIYITRY